MMTMHFGEKLVVNWEDSWRWFSPGCVISTMNILLKEIFDLKMKKGDSGEISERRIQVSGSVFTGEDSEDKISWKFRVMKVRNVLIMFS